MTEIWFFCFTSFAKVSKHFKLIKLSFGVEIEPFEGSIKLWHKKRGLADLLKEENIFLVFLINGHIGGFSE